MIELLKSDDVVRKVGGRFKVAVLIQKRMVDVAFGAPLLVDTKGKTVMEAVIDEIMQEKISLDMSSGLAEVSTQTPPKAARESSSDED